MKNAEERRVKEMKIEATKLLIRDLNALIKKVQKNKKKKEEFVTTIDGEEYHSYNEILEAYGCDMITEAQKDIALRKFYDWESNDLNVRSDILISLVCDIIESLKDLIKRLEKELENDD